MISENTSKTEDDAVRLMIGKHEANVGIDYRRRKVIWTALDARQLWNGRNLDLNGRKLPSAPRAQWLLALLLLTVLLVGLRPALAHERAVEIFRGQDGQFEVVMAALPEKPVVGIVHFSITPVDAASGTVISDADVTLTVSRGPGKRPILARAVNTPAAPQYYDANITFVSSGEWTAVVEVRSDALGEATVETSFNIDERRIPASSSGAFVLLGILVLFAGGVTYLWRSSRRARR